MCENSVLQNKMIFSKPTKDWKRTICIDFDGVIAEYNGWKGPDFFGTPKEGAKKFLVKAKSIGFKIVVFTIRPKERIFEWFKEHHLHLPDDITNTKIPAVVYIDDRGLKFHGNFDSLLEEVRTYKTYWEVENFLQISLIRIK